MSKDVVKKLEYWAFKFSGKGEQEDAASDVMSEALKEIIKLRDETERLARERDEARAGIERLRKDLRQGFPIRYETPAGCLCPAGSNLDCQNSFCPRRDPPGVTCGGGKP